MKYHLLITGRVQGVGFRYTCKLLATKLGIDGWVRNLRTGQVELFLAAEDEEKLEEFLRNLQGHFVGHIKEINYLNDTDAINSPKGFFILPTI